MKYFKSSLFSIILHAALLCGLIFFGAIQGCRMKKQKVDLADFTIAVEPMAIEESPAPPEKEMPKKIEDPPPKKDDIPLETKKDPPKKDPPKPAPKPPEKKPDPPKKDPPKKDPPKIEKGKRITKPPVQPTVKPKVKQTLSDEEIKKWLNGRDRVKIGEVTSLPTNELSRNYSLLKNAFYDAWNQPSKEAAGYRPAEVEFTIEPGGRISNPRLVQSSGSAIHDQSALDAVRSTTSIPGLSPEFIRMNKTLSIEFELK